MLEQSELVNLEESAYHHVVNNSGGIKYTELVSLITALAIENGAPEDYIEALPEQLEVAIRRSSRQEA